MIINLLCDNKDSWFWQTNKEFLRDIKKLGHDIKICKSEKELVKADISAFISCTKIVSNEGLLKSKSNKRNLKIYYGFRSTIMSFIFIEYEYG